MFGMNIMTVYKRGALARPRLAYVDVGLLVRVYLGGEGREFIDISLKETIIKMNCELNQISSRYSK